MDSKMTTYDLYMSVGRRCPTYQLILVLGRQLQHDAVRATGKVPGCIEIDRRALRSLEDCREPIEQILAGQSTVEDVVVGRFLAKEL